MVVTPIRSSVARDRLPRNADAEASVLGGIILRPELLGELTDLDTEAFFEFKHRVVFEAMRNLAAASKPIDVVTLENEIERQGRLEAIGGIAFLGDLTLIVPTADNVHHYAADVDTHYRNRRAIVLLASALERAQTWKHDPRELVLETAGELARLDADRADRERTQKARWCRPMSEFFGSEEPDDDDAQDWIIRDLIPRAEPTLWGGPMKAGKTWAVMDLAMAVALGEGWLGRFKNTLGKPGKVLGLFLEDNERRLGKRLWELARGRSLAAGLNDPQLQETLRISRAPLRLPDAKDQARLISEIKAWGACLVIVDNLTRVMLGDANSTRDAAAFTRAWSEIGEATGATILFLHHTKKANGGNDQREVDPFDQIRGSSDFGATARNIIVTVPLRVDGELLAEVRMRGNLDLQTESFALGFQRIQVGDRWQARLLNRGDVADLKKDSKKRAKTTKEMEKRQEMLEINEHRRTVALSIVEHEKSCSCRRLAIELAIGKTPAAQILSDLVVSGDLRKDSKLGFVAVGAHSQIELPDGPHAG